MWVNWHLGPPASHNNSGQGPWSPTSVQQPANTPLEAQMGFSRLRPTPALAAAARMPLSVSTFLFFCNCLSNKYSLQTHISKQNKFLEIFSLTSQMTIQCGNCVCLENRALLTACSQKASSRSTGEPPPLQGPRQFWLCHMDASRKGQEVIGNEQASLETITQLRCRRLLLYFVLLKAFNGNLVTTNGARLSVHLSCHPTGSQAHGHPQQGQFLHKWGPYRTIWRGDS